LGFAELGQGFVEEALGLVAEAVEAADGGLVDEGVAGPAFALAVVAEETFFGGSPDVGFDPAVAAEEPLVVDEGIEEGALGRGGGNVLVGERRFEGFEFGGVLVPYDHGIAVEAGFQGVAAGCGLALDGARAGGELGVAAVGRELFFGCHKSERGLTAVNVALGLAVTDGARLEVVGTIRKKDFQIL
jgi:hypothetical protein